MGVEIERKFLVETDHWRNDIRRSIEIEQGYLSIEPERTIRVRVQDDRAKLTIKGQARGLARLEFEYEIPTDDGEQILRQFCADRRLEKTRHEVLVEDHLWEVDVFEGVNEGLVVAEVELGRPDETFAEPDWLGEEVTGDVRYYNAQLVQRPYQSWARESTDGE